MHGVHIHHMVYYQLLGLGIHPESPAQPPLMLIVEKDWTKMSGINLSANPDVFCGNSP